MRIRALVLLPVLLVLAMAVLAEDGPAPPAEPPPPGESGASSGPSGNAGTGTSTDQVLYVVRVNPVTHKILVFCMTAPLEGALMLKSIRDYSYDLVLDEMPPQKESMTTAQVKALIEKKHPEYKKKKGEYEKSHKDKKFDAEEWVKGDPADSPLKASDSVSLVTNQGITSWTAGSARGGDPVLYTSVYYSGYFYLIDETNKKIAAYQIVGGALHFVSIRKWDYDDRLEVYDQKLKSPTSANFGSKYMSMEEVKKQVEAQEKKRADAKEKK